MKCVICGKEMEKSLYSNKPLCSDECYERDYWMDMMQDENCIIVNQKCYHVGDDTGGFKGYGGSKFKIVMKETGEIIETNNLWFNGSIPDEFYTEDNAEFLPVREKVPMVGREFDCRQ